MFVSVKQFVDSWSHESKGTQRIMNALTDASLQQRITPDNRTLGQLAWHLAITIPEMIGRTGLELPFPEGGEHAPASAAVIAEAYERGSQALIETIQAKWSDATLLQTSNMYGEEWPNGLTLHILIQHEIHHRGQMTVLMRQAGLRVPGLYGPSREEWIEMGMQPQI